MDSPTDPGAGPALRRTKTGWIGIGVVGLLAGFFALLLPGFPVMPVPALIALLFGLCGIARLAHAVALRGGAAAFGQGVLALLHLVAAGAIAARPSMALPDLTTIVGGWCLAVGLAGAAMAARPPRLPSWGWMLGTSLGCAVLGAFLLVGWTERELGTVALVNAVSLLITGVGLLIAGGSLPRAGLVERPA